MYVLKHKYTGRIYAIYATYGAAISQYELERSENITVDLYEIPDDEVKIPMNEAHQIQKPRRDTIDQERDCAKYEEIMGLSEA